MAHCGENLMNIYIVSKNNEKNAFNQVQKCHRDKAILRKDYAGSCNLEV